MNLRKVITSFPGRSLLLQNDKTFIFLASHQCSCWLKSSKNYLPFVITKRQYVHNSVPLCGVLSDPENKGEAQKGVNFDTIGSWNNRLEMPIRLEKSIEKGRLIPQIPLDKVGTASLVGRRKVNEDRFRIEEINSDLLFFGIFDGHGGDLAVEFVDNHILDHIRFWLTRSSDLFKVLRNSFIDINNVLTRHIAHYKDEYNCKSLRKHAHLIYRFFSRVNKSAAGCMIPPTQI